MTIRFGSARKYLLGISLLTASCGGPAMPDASDVNATGDARDVGTSRDSADASDTAIEDTGSEDARDIAQPMEAAVDAADIADSTSDAPTLDATDVFDASIPDAAPPDAMDVAAPDARLDAGFDVAIDTASDTGSVTDTGSPDAAPDAGPAACTSTLVAPPLGGGTQASVSFDASGEPHVLYADLTDRTVRHAWRVGGVWTREIVDSNVVRDVLEVVGTVRSVIDSRGRIHVAYVVGPQSGSTAWTLRYAVFDAGTWTVSNLGASNSRQTALLVDSHDAPFVAGRTASGTSSSVIASTWLYSSGPSGWTRALMNTESAFDAFRDVALAIDGMDRVWAAIEHEGSMTSVNICEPIPGGWSTVTVTLSPSFDAFRGLSMAVDRAGTLAHVVDGNHYVFGEGAFWSNETLPIRSSSGFGDYQPIVSLDAAGTPTIVHGDWTGTSTTRSPQFVTQRRGTSGWTRTGTYTFDPGTTGSTNYDVSGTDPSGFPYWVGSYAGNTQRLALAQYPAGTQSTSDVDVKERIGNRAVVAAAAPSGSVFVSAWLSGELRIHDVDRSGQVTRYPGITGLYSSTFMSGLSVPAMSFGSDGFVRVAAMGSIAPRGPRISRWNGTSWIDSPQLPGGTLANADQTAMDMVLDAADDPHVVYVRDSSSTHDIYYSSYVGGAWTTETVGQVGRISPAYPQVTMDAAGTPYVSYLSNNVLYFARRQGGVWASAMIGTVVAPQFYTLYVDRMGQVCAAYSLESPYRLIKSCLAGSTIRTEVIATMATTPAPWTPVVLSGGIDADGHEFVLANDNGLEGNAAVSHMDAVRFTFDGVAWTRTSPIRFALPYSNSYPAAIAMSSDHRIHLVSDPLEVRWWDTACGP